MSKEFNLTLCKVQNELNAPKGQYNKFGGFKYRSCEDIVEAVKPILAKYELTLNLSDEIVLIGDRFYIKATATITDGENVVSTSAYAREPLEKKGMDEPQITGTASSYARKYALNGLLAIDDTKDADTDEYAKQTGKEPKQEQKATPKQVEILLTYYKAENLEKLLAKNNISKIQDLPLTKASEIISKLREKQPEQDEQLNAWNNI